MSLRKRSLALHGCVVLYGSLFSAMLLMQTALTVMNLTMLF